MGKESLNSTSQKPFRKFEALVRKLLHVPKASIEDRKQTWKERSKKGERK